MPAAPRHARQIILPQVGPEGQQKLRNASVLCAGLGGLGSPLTLYLAAAGVGRLGLLDFDAVDESNLQRQVLYGEGDLGRPKAEAAAERLRAIAPATELVLLPLRVGPDNAAELIRGFDIVADGTDNYPARYALSDACAAAGKPLVHGAVDRFEGQVSVFWAGKGPCYRCLHPRPPAETPSCAEAGVLGALPGVVGSLQALEVLKLILGAGAPAVGRLLRFDGLALEWKSLAVARDPACTACAGADGGAGINKRSVCMTKEKPVTQIAEITVEDLKAKLDKKEAFQLVDVREEDEYETARIEGAKLIPLGTLPERFSELDKASEIVVHCHHGGRSARAVQFLTGKGYKAVNLAGGIHAWSERIDPAVPQY